MLVVEGHHNPEEDLEQAEGAAHRRQTRQVLRDAPCKSSLLYDGPGCSAWRPVQNQRKAEKAKRKFDAEVDRAEAGLSKAPRRPLTAEERADAEQCACLDAPALENRGPGGFPPILEALLGS